ncbi:MAG: hypothetical protein WBG86_12125 [Polyangiales bacterium]
MSKPNPIIVPRILWAALFVSTCLYVVVLGLTDTEGRTGFEAISMELAIAGSVTAGLSLLGPRLFASTARPAGAADAAGAGTYLVRFILSMALAEAVAIYGLVLGLAGAPTRMVLPFFAVAWVLMLIRFPSREQMEAQ